MADGLRPAPFDVVEASRRVWVERWDDDAASGNAVFTAVLRAHQMLMQQVDAVMKRHDLTFTRYQVLAWLAAEPETARALSWISTVLRVPPATVTNIIDRLESDDMVRRVAHPTDARTTLAELTDLGREVAHDTTVDLNDEVYRPLALGDADRGQLIDLLGSLRANGGEFDVERSAELMDRLGAQRTV
ncbi:MAG: MarR family transcriptional regulator [Acidimicrobiales bacterium]|nr:MarR family transcriptional regulator [Acidimicrobiales bacterium]